MKFYPATDPRSPHYDSKAKAFNEEEPRRRKILSLRLRAQKEMNPKEARKLNAYADQLAQDPLPFPRPKPKKRQTRLFDENLD